MINWTEVLLSLMTLLGSCGWFVAGKKHKQEVEGLKTENQMKKLDLSSEFEQRVCQQVQGVDHWTAGDRGQETEKRSKRPEGGD